MTNVGEAEKVADDDHRLVLRLVALAESLASAGNLVAADTARSAAAHIEGHNEAFRTVVAQKQDLQAQVRQMRTNFDFMGQFTSRWRDLLVALQAENPRDVRLQRALAGEDPMHPSPWEKGNHG